MFSIGFGEIIVILTIAIVFINPKDLPKIANTVGTWYLKLKEVYNGVSKIKENTISIIEKELSSNEDINSSDDDTDISKIK